MYFQPKLFERVFELYRCSVDNGMVFDNEAGVYVKDPTLLIDADSDILLKWGARTNIETHFAERKKVYFKMYQPNPQTIRLICLDKLSADEQCYVLNRMVNYTQSGFVKAFVEHARASDAMEWLHAEMERVPIK